MPQPERTPDEERAPLAYTPRRPLTDDEIEGIVTAVKSAFLRLQNLYASILPVFDQFGFRAPSAGVVARDLSEQIERSIMQHTQTFFAGEGTADLQRFGERWEVKICKDSGLTINQSFEVDGESYVVINYTKTTVKKIWVLWEAEDGFFSPRKRNTNARAFRFRDGEPHVQTIYTAQRTPRQG